MFAYQGINAKLMELKIESTPTQFTVVGNGLLYITLLTEGSVIISWIDWLYLIETPIYTYISLPLLIEVDLLLSLLPGSEVPTFQA